MTSERDGAVRLMLVDDHPLVRDGLRARLEAVPDLRVVGEAGHAREALELAPRCRPDLALIDISMPDMDGLELVKLLGESHPGIASLILTMFDKAAYVRHAMRAGARGYLLKDSPATDIIAAIRAVAAGGCYFSASLMPGLAGLAPAQATLTDRERQVLDLVAGGASNKRIAQLLGISCRTVETHRLSVRRKLGIESTAGLVRYALDDAGRPERPPA